MENHLTESENHNSNTNEHTYSEDGSHHKFYVWTNFWYWFWFILVVINILGILFTYAFPQIAQSLAATDSEILRFLITSIIANIMFTLKGSIASLIIFAYISNKLMFYSVASTLNETRTIQQAIYYPSYDSFKYSNYSKQYNKVRFSDIFRYFGLFPSGVIFTLISFLITIIVTVTGLYYLYKIFSGSPSSIADIFMLSVVIYEAVSITKYTYTMTKLTISKS